MNKIDKPYIFITGAPRSGTSMLTKVIDAHPDIGIFMENIFGLRRRHWQFPEFWNSEEELFKIVQSEYAKLKEPIVGNKVCTPDVWNTDEILKMASFFSSTKVVFIVRDPIDVIKSRLKRDDETEYNDLAKNYLCLDWKEKNFTSLSSWRQSIEVYWKLKEYYQNNIYLIYYDDFVVSFKEEVMKLFKFLNVNFHDNIIAWHEQEHYDAKGRLKKDLKYKDEKVKTVRSQEEIKLETNLLEYLNNLVHYNLWKKREL